MNNPMIAAAGGSFLDLEPPLHHPSHRPPIPHLSPNKAAAGTPSDDEDHLPPAGAASEETCAAHGKKASPWHRMKWTDDVVRFLIQLVAFVGDDGAPEDVRKHGAGPQKKGKWKTVSRLMLERGCYVSPQQCEDKFNDLNKRYKRLYEILGRGTSCQVVENPALLDSMPHIPLKAKDDVRKILCSKQLFYREMCAYHNGQSIPNCHGIDPQVAAIPGAAPLKEGYDHEDVKEDEENGDDEEHRSDEMRNGGFESFLMEMDGTNRDASRPAWEQHEWFENQALELQAERVEIEAEALELERRCFKWQRFKGKKDREIKRLMLENERMNLENDRMAMQVRWKELELDLSRTSEGLEATLFPAGPEHGQHKMELGNLK